MAITLVLFLLLGCGQFIQPKTIKYLNELCSSNKGVKFYKVHTNESYMSVICNNGANFGPLVVDSMNE
jgi:hypothetical protein